MSEKDELIELIDQMRFRQVEFAPGLSDAEISEIEQMCIFQFPADLRTFLQLGVPLKWTRHNENGEWIDNRFPNWREDPLAIMSTAREWIVRGFHFDIEHSDFWMQEWGTRPQELNEAFVIVDRFLETVPLLIPLYAHRFLPAQPNLPGNPVFSVWQAVDTIYYGYSLQNYLRNEFVSDQHDWGQPSDYRYIAFWSNIVS